MEIRRAYLDLAPASRALNLPGQDLGRVSRPYNRVVLPLPASCEWYVYLMPAPTRDGYWPPADTRYRISSDGRQVREKRRSHNSVIEYGPPKQQDGAQLDAAYHTAVLDDRPEGVV